MVGLADLGRPAIISYLQLQEDADMVGICKLQMYCLLRAGLRSNSAEGEEGGKHEYCLLALEHLLERAQAYRAAGQPVRWGWCRSPLPHSPHHPPGQLHTPIPCVSMDW